MDAYAGHMLVAEELFLLLRRDDGRAESAFGWDDYALNGAVLSDLLAAGYVSLRDGKDPRVSVRTSDPVGHPVLDGALERLRARDGRKLSSLVTDGKIAPRDRIAASLADAGIVTLEPKRALGLVPARYPVLDPGPERALRERLRAVLAGASPTPGEAALLSLLKGVDMVGSVLREEKGSLSRRDLKRRIDEVSSEAVVGRAVAKAIEGITAALAAVVIVAAAGSG